MDVPRPCAAASTSAPEDLSQKLSIGEKWLKENAAHAPNKCRPTKAYPMTKLDKLKSKSLLPPRYGAAINAHRLANSGIKFDLPMTDG